MTVIRFDPLGSVPPAGSADQPAAVRHPHADGDGNGRLAGRRWLSRRAGPAGGGPIERGDHIRAERVDDRGGASAGVRAGAERARRGAAAGEVHPSAAARGEPRHAEGTGALRQRRFALRHPGGRGCATTPGSRCRAPERNSRSRCPLVRRAPSLVPATSRRAPYRKLIPVGPEPTRSPASDPSSRSLTVIAEVVPARKSRTTRREMALSVVRSPVESAWLPVGF